MYTIKAVNPRKFTVLIVKTSDMTTQVKVAWFWFGCKRWRVPNQNVPFQQTGTERN
jgi:hypothetical protein